MLVVLDNCEHVLDASAALVETLLSGTTNVTVLATSREPIGVAGESIWRVPSLSLEGEAVELFTDRARLARPDFHVTTGNATTVTEICQRLDGVPLAIELAAARVRALTVAQIADSLHDRFRLLTGGARAAVRRQQTLRASVDWSHALLTEPERVLFRRLGVFVGGFDLDAAQAVGAENKIERFQVLDLLGLLIDKSLVLAEDQDGTMRYRLLETVRQYAQEKLGESGEADVIRTRHCDHYRGLAESDQAEAEIDNLRTAFTWSRESEDISTALEIASGLYPIWSTRGRYQEGLAWFDTVLTKQNIHDAGIPAAVRARALADKVALQGGSATATGDSLAEGEWAVALARETDDRTLLFHALAACARIAIYRPREPNTFAAEAVELARTIGDLQLLTEILTFLPFGDYIAGEPTKGRASAEEGIEIAEGIGAHDLAQTDLHLRSRIFRTALIAMQGELRAARDEFDALLAEPQTAESPVFRSLCRTFQSFVLTYLGEWHAALLTVESALDDAPKYTNYLADPNSPSVHSQHSPQVISRRSRCRRSGLAPHNRSTRSTPRWQFQRRSGAGPVIPELLVGG